MNHRRAFLATLLAAAVAAAAAGCSVITGPSTTSFVIRVDSLTGANAVPGALAAEQYVWGHVGPDGCYRFDRFDVVRSTGRLDVTVRGQHTTGPDVVCAQIVVDLRGEPLRIDPPIQGVLTIVVHQPDGTTLTRQMLGE